MNQNSKDTMARELDPPTAPSRSTDLPEHLVESPAVRGLRRIGVGTLPFSLAAAAVLVAMSAFVVMTPTSLTGDRGDSLAGADEPVGTTAPPTLRAADARAGRDATTTSTSAAPGTTPATSATTATTAAPTTGRPAPRATTPTTSAPRREGQLVSMPTSVKPVRCEDFTLQPEAQAAFDADRTGRAGMDGDGDGVACEQLPGRPNPDAPIVARRIPTVDQLRLPETRLFGVHTPQAPYATSELTGFAAAAGKTPNTVLFFQNFSQEFPQRGIDAAWDLGMLPMITFEPIIQDSTVGQPKLADIVRGDHDEYFTRWAEAARADGRPIAFRFAQEMNGNWYPWSDARFGNAPGDFVAAWRHLHDLMSDAGADNVLWVWSINRVDNLPDKTLARVYPGAGYVDWIGISGYLRNVPDGVTPTFDFTFGRTLDAIAALGASKPIMLTEVGAGTTEQNRVDWLASFFQGLLDHPEIIGFNWFNDFKDGGDWRIQYSAATSAAFAAGVSDLRYGELAPPIT